MALRPLTGIALCAGVGMLDVGIGLALQYLGRDYRTVCYVEREAAAAAQLVTLMEAGALDQAPIWSDLLTFDARPWRGKVDCLTAGFPCQPHSVAGKREGLSDARWIWPAIARLVGELGCEHVFLENVPGLASTGGLDACIGDLAALGFDAEWGVLSAAAVGASHNRERLFILAHTSRNEWGRIGREDRRGRRVRGAGDQMANTESLGRRIGQRDEQPRRKDLANASSSRSQGCELGIAYHECGGAQAYGSVSELCGAFAPGPNDARWSDILRAAPWLAPALANSSNNAGSRRLNPRFAEWLMGWPIGWTEDNLNAAPETSGRSNQQSFHSKARSARRFARWREVQLVRMHDLLGPSPLGLFETGTSDHSLPPVPSKAGPCRRDMDGELHQASGVHRLQNDVSTSAKAQGEDLLKPGVPENTWQDECREALELRSDRLRAIGNGVVPLSATCAYVQLIRRAELA